MLTTSQIQKDTHSGRNFFFFGIRAFLAGFSERFTGVIFGGAERLISGGDAGAGASDSGHADVKATTPAGPPAEARAPRPASPDRPVVS